MLRITPIKTEYISTPSPLIAGNGERSECDVLQGIRLPPFSHHDSQRQPFTPTLSSGYGSSALPQRYLSVISPDFFGPATSIQQTEPTGSALQAARQAGALQGQSDMKKRLHFYAELPEGVTFRCKQNLEVTRTSSQIHPPPSCFRTRSDQITESLNAIPIFGQYHHTHDLATGLAPGTQFIK
jgi:hypothetical protein